MRRQCLDDAERQRSGREPGLHAQQGGEPERDDRPSGRGVLVSVDPQGHGERGPDEDDGDEQAGAHTGAAIAQLGPS